MNADFRDMLSALSDAGAEYLLVGAYAMAAHGLPRATGDLDLWVRADGANAERVLRALAAFGAPVADLTAADLSQPATVYQIGLAPARIDLLTEIDGVEFQEAWSARVELNIEGVRVPVIGRGHLLQNKRASGRPRDLADAEWLERTGNG